MVSCREAAEESCYALGAPRSLRVNFFDAGKVTTMFGGAWLADMGVLSTAEQEKIIQAHHANRTGALWRQPKRCELEMTRLQWCEAREFLIAVESCGIGKGITVPSLGSRFRNWTTEYYVRMSKKDAFRKFCLTAAPSTDQHSHSSNAGNCSFNEVEQKKSAQDEPHIHSNWSKVLNLAKFGGQKDAVWERIFTILHDMPERVDRRRGRNFSLLHHAAYWGNLKAAQTLVHEFKADTSMHSKDGQTPSQVAFDCNHAPVGKFLSQQIG